MYDEFKSEVRGIVEARLRGVRKDAPSPDELVGEYGLFVEYCASQFGTDHKEAHKCAVGILAYRDSLAHPEKYSRFNMSSMFELHRLSRLILEDEDAEAVARLEAEIAEALGK